MFVSSDFAQLKLHARERRQQSHAGWPHHARRRQIDRHEKRTTRRARSRKRRSFSRPAERGVSKCYVALSVAKGLKLLDLPLKTEILRRFAAQNDTPGRRVPH